MATLLLVDNPPAMTVNTAVSTAPASGTSETWSVTIAAPTSSQEALPALSAGVNMPCYMPSGEIVYITAGTLTAGVQSLTVSRAMEGSPVATYAGGNVIAIKPGATASSLATLNTSGLVPLAELSGITASQIATGGTLGKLQLEYIAATDISAGTTLTASTWTDVGSNQSFTVDDANSTVIIIIEAGMLLGQCGGCGARAVVDSAGTPVNKLMGGGYAGSGEQGNGLVGGCVAILTGLSAGTHTVKLQVNVEASYANQFALRCSTRPNWESFSIKVFEIKR